MLRLVLVYTLLLQCAAIRGSTSHAVAKSRLAGPTAAPLKVVAPNSDPIADFPSGPPCELASTGRTRPADLPSLGGNLATEIVGLRVRRNFLTVTGRDLTIANASGWYLYATEGQVFTFHSNTYLYEAETGRRLAMISTTLLSIHRIFEVVAYDPVCPTQNPADEKDEGDVLVYPRFRLTKSLLTAYPHWTLERYTCDGSLEKRWTIQTRYWFQLYKHFDVYEPEEDKPVGTVDQAYLFQWTPNYNVWVSKGEDVGEFAMLAALVDMNVLFETSSQSSNDHGRGHSK